MTQDGGQRPDDKRTAILVHSLPGQPTVGELEREAATGERPRKDYVELARLLGAEVVDSHYMRERALPAARALAQRRGLPLGQVAEAFLRRRFSRIVAWSDDIAVRLALLFKLARSRRDLIAIFVVVSSPRRAQIFGRFHGHSHVRAIVTRRAQVEIAIERLGVPAEKLYRFQQPVDERFWRPVERQPENLVCSVGWESRDYPTLIEAIRELPLDAELAVSSVGLERDPDRVSSAMKELAPEGPPPNIRLAYPSLSELRDLYARSRFAVLPTKDVEYDAGSTVLTEAMAMGKAVIATRSRGLRDFFEDGVHGIFVPPGDIREMRAAIDYLLQNPHEADQMGRAGRALVEERHAMDVSIGDLAAFIRATGSRRSVVNAVASG